MNDIGFDERAWGLALDHLIIAVPDLEHAPLAFADAYKVEISGGGVHPRHGTANKLALLNGHYLEFLTVRDADVAQDGWLGMAATRAISTSEPLMTWAIRTTDLARTREYFEAAIGDLPPVEPGERLTDSGNRISWRIQHLYELSTPVGDRVPLPFFIEWEDPATQPGAAGAAIAPHSCVTQIVIGASGSDARTAAAIAVLGKLSFVRVEHSLSPGVHSVTLETPTATGSVTDDRVVGLWDNNER